VKSHLASDIVYLPGSKIESLNYLHLFGDLDLIFDGVDNSSIKSAEHKQACLSQKPILDCIVT
jgi:hypothetical protein